MEKIVLIILAVVIVIIIGLVLFHIIHYRLFCRYKKDAQKSHCQNCGHLKICKQYHHKQLMD